MLKIASSFTNYVSEAAENKYLFKLDRIWDNGFWEQKSNEEAYAKWENYCSVSISKDMWEFTLKTLTYGRFVQMKVNLVHEYIILQWTKSIKGFFI